MVVVAEVRWFLLVMLAKRLWVENKALLAVVLMLGGGADDDDDDDEGLAVAVAVAAEEGFITGGKGKGMSVSELLSP